MRPTQAGNYARNLNNATIARARRIIAGLPKFIDPRLLATIVGIALVACVLTATAYMQNPRPAQDARPVERASTKNITRASDESADKNQETAATSAIPFAPEVASNYTFTTATNASLTDMSTGTTQLLAANIDDTASSLTVFPFDFFFQGVRYNSFGVNENGVLRLNGTAQASTPYKPLAQAGIPILTAYGADQRTHAGDGKVHTKMIGTAPNRAVVVEWLNNQANFDTGGTADLTYQIRFYETTGVIEYVYGKASMSTLGAAATNSKDPNIGFSSNNTAGNVGSVTAAQSGAPSPTFNGALATPVANLYTAGTIPVLDSVADGSRRIFTFTPPTPTAPTNLTFSGVTASAMTLNWTDSANETLYAVYRSTDGINYSFFNTTAQNVATLAVSGLNPSTTYFWQVYAVSEGALSTALAGSQATAAAPTITSTAVGGNWSVGATWIGGVVPTATDNVVIADLSTVTIDVTTATCLNLQVGQGISGTLQYLAGTASTLTVNSNVTVSAGGTFTAGAGALITHNLNIGGNAASAAAGNLTVNGTFDMNTTAGVITNFFGSSDGTVSGAGATCDFFSIVINKGSSTTPVLDVTRVITQRAATTGATFLLTLTNGTFKLSTASTITPYQGNQTICASTGRLWVNNAAASVTSNGVGTGTGAGSPTINGTLRVDAGTFGYGSGNNTMTVGATGTLIIGGANATVNMFGAVTFTSGATFTMTAGNFNVDPQASNTTGATTNIFRLNSVNVSFTGGTLTIVDPHALTGTGTAFSISTSVASTFNFAGSTIRFGNGVSTTAGSVDGFDFDTFVGNALVPIGNVTVDNTATNAATRFVRVANALSPFTTAIGGNLNVTNTGGSEFRLNAHLAIIGGNVTNDGTLNGTTTNSRLYFQGAAAQTYSGAGVVTAPLASLDVDNPLGLTLTSTNQIITSRVDLFRGTVTNSNKITLGNGGATTALTQIGVASATAPGGSYDQAPVFNAPGSYGIIYAQETVGRTTGFEIPASRVVTFISEDNTNHVTLAGGNLTITTIGANVGTVTLTNGRFITGSNTLVLNSAVTQSTVTRTSGYVDGNLQKTYTATGTKTFEVGTANGYSPVAVNATAGTFPANFTVKGTQGAMPGITGANKLARYWTLTSPGVITGNLTFTYLAGDVTGTVANYQFIKKSGADLSTLAPTGTPTSTSAVINGVSSFSDWTLAEATAVQSGSLQFSSPTYSVSESGTSINVDVTRTGGTDGNVGVSYTTNAGSATAGSDYSTTAGTLSWTVGDSANKTINIPIAPDAIFEGNEDFTVTLSLPTGGATLGSPNPATVTITDDDPAVLFSINDVTQAEGNAGTTSYTFTVTKTGATASNATVDYATVDGSATSPSDFTAIPTTTLTFLPADTTKQFTVFVNGDTTIEPSESFFVNLSNVSGATISDAQGIGYVITDDMGSAGGKIVFSAFRAIGHDEIFVMNGDGTAQTRVTYTDGYVQNTFPIFSPDGSKIAFVSTRDGNQEIYIMNADGTGQTNITNVFQAEDSFPSFSPDGSKIVFSSQRTPDGPPNTDIYVMNTDGTGVTRLTTDLASDYAPSYSPDGSRIVFTTDREGEFDNEIYIMSSNGSGQINLTNNTGVADVHPFFSPDGSKIVFFSNRDGGYEEIYTMGPSGGGDTRLTNNPAADVFPFFSPDGSKIAFQSLRDDNDPEIYVMNSDGNGVVRLTIDPDPDSYPRWAVGDVTAFSIDDVTHMEGNAGTTSYTFTVTKTGPAAGSVNFATVDGTATLADTDYTANSGTLNFNAADTTMQVTVLVNGDTAIESDEAFGVTLSNSVGALISDADGAGTIVNDDVAPTDIVFNADGNLPAGTYNNVTINGPCPTSHYVTLTGNVVINGTFTINDCGNLYTNGFDVSGPGAFVLNADGWLHITSPQGITSGVALAGNIQTTGGRTFSSAANYDYDGNVNQVVGNGLPGTVNDLLIANSGTSPNNVVTGQSGQVVTTELNVITGVYLSGSDYNNVIIQTNGTLSLANNITVSGNWTNDGSFIANGKSVTFDGGTGQTLAGNTSFFNLTKSTGAAQTLIFTAGSTQTVTNSLTLTGAAGNLLSLRSTTPGTQWKLIAPATQSVTYVSAQDSDATGPNPVNATNSINSGNNINWIFAQAAVVYVDPSYTGTPGTDPDGAGSATSIGYDAFATIQGGVDGVIPSGNVIVNSGTYTENVTIPKALTMTGAGAASVFVYPAVSDPNCGGAGGGSLCAGSSNLILVQASNVTISGMTLDGDNTGLTSAYNVGGANIDARNGIITNHPMGVFNSLEVHHTTVKNIYLRGIYASSGGTFNFHDNTVQNVQASASSIGMFNFAGAGAFTNNNVSACNDGIASNHSRGTTYTGNTVTTSASGIHSDNAGDSGGTPDTISGNTVTNSQIFGYGIWVYVPYKTVTVQNNTVANVDVGHAVFGDSGVTTATRPSTAGDGPATGKRAPKSANVSEPGVMFQSPDAATAPPAPPYAASFTGNTVDGQNKVNSTGVYFSTSQLGFGSGNPKIAFTSNTVVNNADGFYIEAETGFTIETAASFNRIVSNTNSQVTQASGAGFTGTVNGSMENNWWGCNAGPNNLGCGSIIGAGIDFNPWIVLTTSASPNPIGPGGTSTVTADMTHNSDTLVPGGGFVPSVGVGFTSTQGTMSPTSGTITSGQATSQFTSTSTSSGTATSTVDSQPAGTTIVVVLPAFSIDDVTHNEGNGGPGTTSYTFTITKTGPTTFNSSVDYATVDGTAVSTGGSPDFTAITTTNVVFLPADTTKQFTVFVNGDTSVEPDEAFTAELSNAVDATISDASGTGTITNDDACGVFATVYVDDNWVGTTPGTDPDGIGPATNFGCDSFATIQGGINGVASGGTVIVRAGTYAEAVLVNKALTLQGAQFGQDAGTRFAAFTSGVNGPKANPAVESIITAAANAPASGANDTVHIMANNVTMDGFVVDGNNPALSPTGATVIGGINTDSRRAIQTEDAAGNPFAATGTTVRYNVIQNYSQRGVELINGTASNTAPATSSNVITRNLVRNFGLDGIVLAFNAYADITFNTVVTNDYPTEAGIWVQDFLNTGTPYPINIANNTVTVGQDNYGGIWANLAYLPTLNINNNTVNAAASVVSGSDFTYGIYVTSLRPGSNASLNANIVGSSGGQFDRGIALWNLGTGQTATVTGGTVGNSVKGVSLHDNDPNFGLAGSNSAASLSGVAISGTGVTGGIGVFVDAAGSTGDTVAMEVSGNTAITNTVTAVSVVGANASANVHDNLLSIHDNTTAISLQSGSLTLTHNYIYANGTSLYFGTSPSGGFVTAHFNRIISATTAYDNSAGRSTDLVNNWWGCNAGPGNSGCGAVTGTAGSNPWLVLGVSATPSSVNPGGASTVTADMTKNSAAADTTGLGTLAPLPVAWSATNGTMSPTSGTITSGMASSMFTSTSTAPGSACATVDNQLTCTPITINAPSFSIDDVTHNEGDAGTTSYTFTITKTGTTAFSSSVDYATVDGSAVSTGGTPDFTAIPTTNVVFAPADTTKQFTVFVNGDTTFEPDEAFTANLSNASGATIADANGTGTITNDDSACPPPATVYVDDSWVGTTPGADPDGIGPATNFGCDSFATIQGGIDGVASGGTVIVYAGTYTQTGSISLNKSLVLRGPNSAISPNGGARVAEALINGAVSPVLRISLPGSPVTIEGFKFDNTGVVDAYDPALNITIRKNIYSNGTTNGAFYFLNAPTQLTFDDNYLTAPAIADEDSMFVAGNWNGTTGTAVTITNNVWENALSTGMNLSSVSGTISGNRFTNLPYYAILLANSSGSLSIDNNVFDGITNPDPTNVPTWGAGVRFYTPSFIGPVNIKSNTFKNSYVGVGVRASGGNLTGMDIHVNFNRIVGNTFGIRHDGTGPLEAQNNWWGCNAGPGNAGCDSVSEAGAGNTDFNPWLVLGVSASPSSIGPGQTSTVTADMRFNSDGFNTSGAGTLPPTPVSFSATNGSMSPTTGTVTAGLASSTFTSNSTSSGSGCATVDNQLVCTPITVAVPSFSIDDVTQLEGDPPGTTSFTFTITKTGGTASNSSVDYATVNGSATAPSDFTAITTTNVVFLPSDTTKQVTVFVNRDTSIEPNEAFTVHLSNPSAASISDADGTGTITNDDSTLATISGHINYADGITPGKNVTMTLTGTGGFVTQMTTTDSNGDYSFTNIPAGNNYTLTPSKTGDVNGIESLDASNVARYVAGLDVPTANQKIAADADGDGILTSFDASLIARYVAGLPGFGIVSTWKFVPVNRTYTTLAADQTGQNFTAILVGDTSGNWMPAVPAGDGNNPNNVGPSNPDTTLAVNVSMPHMPGAPGSTITVPVTVGDMTGQGVKAYDLQVTFNPAIIQPQVTPFDTGATNSASMLITPNTTNSGHFIISAFQATDLSGSGTLIKLKFTVVGAPGQSTPLSFQDYTDPGTIFHPGFRFNAGTPTVTTTNGSVTVNGPTAAAGTVRGRITDALGRPVSGAVVSLTGTQSRKTITDTDGNYSFDEVPSGGFYTVTPSRANFGFSPAARSFNLLENTTEAVFTAVPVSGVANPLDTTEYFVRQHYLDFLGREPDEAGFNFWSDQMLECGADAECLERRRVNVSAAYFLSIEFQETGGLVDGLYRASYGARPQYAEFLPDVRTIAQNVVVGNRGWQQQLAANKQAFIQAFVNRAAFQAAFDNLSNEAYVDTLISHTRVAFNESERAALVDGLTQGTLTRALALQHIAENQQFVSAKRNEAFVMMQYFGYLRRDPDESGYQFWLSKLNQFDGNFERAEMVKAFIVSGEYRARFAR